MHVAGTRDSWPSETSMWRVQLQWIIYLNKLRSEVLTSLHESVDVFTFRCRIQYWCSVRNVRVTHLNAIELHNFVLWLPLKSDRNAVVPAGYGCKKCTHWNGWRQWRRGCHHHKAFDISDVFSSCLQNKISILGLQVSRVIRVAGYPVYNLMSLWCHCDVTRLSCWPSHNSLIIYSYWSLGYAFLWPS